MECERCNLQLSMLLDGRLSARQERRVREHLALCRRCREDLAELGQLRILLGNLPSPSPSPEFWARTTERLRENAPTRAVRRMPALRFRYGLGLSAAAAVAAMVLFSPRSA